MYIIGNLSKLRSDIGPAIHDAMNQYFKNMELKKEIDNLQFRIGCCGSDSYKDWQSKIKLKIKFKDMENDERYQQFYHDKRYKESHPNDDKIFSITIVPFTCCNTSYPSCLFYDLDKKYNVHDEDVFPNKTIYVKGKWESINYKGMKNCK